VVLRDAVKESAETLFRWVPFPIEPGLRVFGDPGEDSPVLLTCNFDLTVKMVSKHLQGLDCYLLIAPSKGINVWCASCGGDFNEFSVISAIKTSGINDKVKHRILIAPQLSAPGIDVDKVKGETGWSMRFGPVYAKDISKYIRGNYQKTQEMRLVKFDLKDRIEMAAIYFVTIALILSLPLLIFYPSLYMPIVSFACLMILTFYVSFPFIPARSGFIKVIIGELFILLFISTLSTLITGSPFRLLYLMKTSVLIAAVIGVDFNGTSPTYKSDLSELLYHHGFKRLPFFTGVYKLGEYGEIQLDVNRCSGCGLCLEVCPRGVYIIDSDHRKAEIVQGEACVNCGACVQQCPHKALMIA
jgi:NAD-dependent dihydropyrimidine dehydrogenase PreA subunit